MGLEPRTAPSDGSASVTLVAERDSAAPTAVEAVELHAPQLYSQIPQFRSGADGEDATAPKTRLLADALASLRVDAKDGLLVWSDSLVPLDASSVPAGECRDGFAIYVVLASGALYATFSSNTVHHPALADGGAPVAACGTMLIRQGRLLMVDNCSGHYRPPAACLEVVMSRMREMRVSVSEAEVRAVSADGRASEVLWPAGSLTQTP